MIYRFLGALVAVVAVIVGGGGVGRAGPAANVPNSGARIGRVHSRARDRARTQTLGARRSAVMMTG